jgi:hypothetical protein
MANSTNDIINGDFELAQIARGLIQGKKLWTAFGERSATTGEVDFVIWPNGPFSIPAATGVQMTLSSTSADDAAAGTGIQSVHLHYLDGNLDEQDEIVTLNGLTGVTTVATDIRFIQCMHIATVGTGLKAAGTISAVNSATTYSQIATGKVRCSSSARMVPRGKRLLVYGAFAGAKSATAAGGFVIRLASTEIEGHKFTSPQFVLFPHLAIPVQDGSIGGRFDVPFPVSAGQVVAITESAPDKDGLVAASWFGVLENA